MIADFYDEFSRKLLADYAFGNARLEAAITHALGAVPEGAARILDVGCGIGWSTWEVKRAYPTADVTGVDLSSAAIGMASRLFRRPGLAFTSGDIVHGQWGKAPPYDVVVMLDVYEHIRRQDRPALHAALDALLRAVGTLVLTIPSVAHQRWLRECHPEGLQPVDEDVTGDDLALLASAIGGRIDWSRSVTIWRPGDYVHVTINRGAVQAPNGGRARFGVEPACKRRYHAEDRLNCRVTREGLLLPQRGGPSVCIVAPSRNIYSETFIRAHLEGLPARVRGLFGYGIPDELDDGSSILLRALRVGCIPGAIGNIIRGGVAGAAGPRARCWAVADFFRRERIEVVLAEYGPTGVALLPACQSARVPLVVHFHGYDASDETTLRAHAVGDGELFRHAAAIVAPSNRMRERLVALGAPAARVHTNCYGVDTSRFAGADPAVAEPRFIAVGRFVEKKAPPLTLLAFQRALREVPDARLIMVGDGPLLGPCRELAGALGIAHAVEFRGARSANEVAALMRSARAFVQHSIRASSGDSEGTPVAVLEAGAAGLPVVATRHEGIPEVVREGETGLLVEERDVDGMANHMITLARSPALAAQLGTAARAHVVARFSLDASLTRLHDLLVDAVEAASLAGHD